MAALAVSGGQAVRTLSIGFDIAEADEAGAPASPPAPQAPIGQPAPFEEIGWRATFGFTYGTYSGGAIGGYGGYGNEEGDGGDLCHEDPGSDNVMS